MPRDGASLDCDALNAKRWWCRDISVSSFKLNFRWAKGADSVWSTRGWWDIGIDAVERVEGEFACLVVPSDVEDCVVVIDVNLGKLKQARRIKWREFDFDGRTIPGLESSAIDKILYRILKSHFVFT